MFTVLIWSGKRFQFATADEAIAYCDALPLDAVVIDPHGNTIFEN